MLSDKHPDRPIILMTESLNFGALPIRFGAPGIRPKGLIAVGLNPILLTSIDHPPFGPGLPVSVWVQVSRKLSDNHPPIAGFLEHRF